MLKLIRNEAQIGAVWLTAALFLIFGSGWFAAAASNTGLTLLLFAWLFAAILWGAFGVVRHAEHLAETHRHVPGVRAAAVPAVKERGPLPRPSWH